METAAMLVAIISSTMSLSAVAMSRVNRRRQPADQITITITDAAGRCERMVARSGKRAKELLRDVERAVQED
jgi:predicted secreted protein